MILGIGAPIATAVFLCGTHIPVRGMLRIMQYVSAARIVLAILLLTTIPTFVLLIRYGGLSPAKPMVGMQLDITALALALSPFSYGAILLAMGGTWAEFFGLCALSSLVALWWFMRPRRPVLINFTIGDSTPVPERRSEVEVFLVRAAIVGLVFPVLVLVTRQPFKYALMAIARWRPDGAGGTLALGWCVLIAGLVVPFSVAWWVCWRLWPRETTQATAVSGLHPPRPPES